MLPYDVFCNIVKNTPLVSIDLIIYNQLGQVLVGMRNNKPAQHYWFVPGGRILKDETVETAYQRIIKAEFSTVDLPLAFDYPQTRFRGVYQHKYADNFSGDPSFGTHYVVLAHEIRLTESMDLIPGDQQHRHYKWLSIEELLANPEVHLFTKGYFTDQGQHSQNGGVFPLFKG